MVGVLQPLLRFWSGKWIRVGSLDSGQSGESHIRIILRNSISTPWFSLHTPYHTYPTFTPLLSNGV